MIYGYARVSSVGQQRYGTSLESQRDELIQRGAEQIFCDTFTGTKRHRPELDKLLGVIQPGDTIIVTKLDRIARSTRDGIEIIDDIVGRGVNLHILNMGLFDSSPVGKLMRTVLLGVAEFERDMIVERTRTGKEQAKANNPNYREGRKPVEFDLVLFESLRHQVDSGDLTVSDASRQLGISRAKWYRLVAS